MTTGNKNQRFRVAPTLSRDGDLRVDREAGIIYGVSVATRGVVKDRRCELDNESLRTILQLGSEKEGGVKCRLTHPNMCDDGTANFLGVFKSFRPDDDRVRADLHVASVANKSPSVPGAANWVYEMAEDHPEQFGTSVVIDWDAEFQTNEDGTRMTDEDGKDLPPRARINLLRACDVVGNPAANDGLFSDGSPSDWASRATTLFDTAFGELDPDEQYKRAMNFINRAITNRNEDWRAPVTTSTKGVAAMAQETPAVEAAQEVEPVDIAKLQADAKAEALAEERTRQKEIRALCASAGREDEADKLIDAEFSVETARVKLFEVMCQERTVLDAGGGDEVEGKSATLSAREAEFTEYASQMRDLGVSRETYCTEIDPLDTVFAPEIGSGN